MPVPIVISTTQAPDAKPVVRSLRVTTTEAPLITVPQYEVPELVFGGSFVVENGVGEVISPLILCNTTANTVSVSVRAERYAQEDTINVNDINDLELYFAKNLQIPGYETIALPLNGQFFRSGDELRIVSDTDFAVVATISFTLGQAEENDV